MKTNFAPEERARASKAVAEARGEADNVAVRQPVHRMVLAGIVAALFVTWAGASALIAAPQESDKPGGKSSVKVPDDAKVDLNAASLDELLKVPGMGRTWALRIVKYRPYRSKADLLEKGILPGDVYARIRDYVVAHRVKKVDR